MQVGSNLGVYIATPISRNVLKCFIVETATAYTSILVKAQDRFSWKSVDGA